jgi:hypothetical protein
MDRRNLRQMETLICLHWDTASQTQSWKTVPCETFDTELEQVISSPASPENLGCPDDPEFGCWWLLPD